MGCFGLFAVSGTNFSIDSIVNVIEATAKEFRVTDANFTVRIVAIVPGAWIVRAILGSVERSRVRNIL